MRISIHALREEGDTLAQNVSTLWGISIHALREEGDHCFLFIGVSSNVFLSTPSARRATHSRQHGTGLQAISIHALREEGDIQRRTVSKLLRNFYPRPPRGGRPTRSHPPGPAGKFLSTPSARRATPGFIFQRRPARYFYPRPPRGGRLVDVVARIVADGISIHALREEGDGTMLENML